MPSFGIKLDACPGRINTASFLVLREGVFYGQCSEICGVNHSFMPIVVNVVEKPSAKAYSSNIGFLEGLLKDVLKPC